VSGPFANDVQLAREIAGAAGAALVALREAGALQGAALGKRGDRLADDLILGRLRASRPEDFILSEESRDDPARCAADRVWVVDPLDGTSDYAAGLDDWAVHVGLSVGGVPAAGAVALPMLGRVYASDDPPRPRPSGANRPRMVVSRTRCADLVTRVAGVLDAEIVPMGSAGAKAMAVVDGRADIYLHVGGQYQWDNCAPAAVALAAGLHASRVDGTPLAYNCLDPLLPDLLICRPELAGAVLSAVERLRDRA
jgi:3'(2'), 5'-bisphosphate nucleotidase